MRRKRYIALLNLPLDLSSMLVAGGSAEAADTRQRFGFGRNGPHQLSYRGPRSSGAWHAP